MNDEWVETTLGGLCDVQVGPAFKSEVFRSAPDGTRLLRGINLGPQGTRWDEVYLWPDERLEEFRRFLLNEGDVCIAMDATFTSGGQIRAARMASIDLPALLVQRVARLRARPDSGLDQDFLALVVGSGAFRGHLSDRQTGAFAPHISATDLKSFSISLPPLPVQRRIVDLMAHLDNHLANLQTELVSNQSAEFAILGTLASLTSGATPDSSLSDHSSVFDCEHKTAPTASPTDVVFGYSIGTRDIKDGLLLVSQAKPVTHETWVAWSRRVQVQPGDVILSREAPVGSVAVVPSDAPPICLGQRTVLIRPKNGIDGMLLSGILRSPEIQRWMHHESAGLTVAHLNVADIKRLPMNTSNLNAKVGERSSAFSALLDHRQRLQSELSSLRSFRSALLTALLSGDHRVPREYDVFLSEVA